MTTCLQSRREVVAIFGLSTAQNYTYFIQTDVFNVSMLTFAMVASAT